MTKRFVSIWFPWLVAEWYVKRNPQWQDQAVVGTTSIKNRKIITALNTEAEERGIYQGMPLADARVTIPDLHCFDEQEDTGKKILQKFAEWCMRFSPLISVDESSSGLFINATGCCHLWNGEKKYLEAIQQQFSAAGFHCRIAIADTAGAAWAICRFSNQQLVITGRHYQVLLSLPPEALRLKAEVSARLHQLGINKLKDLVSLPRSSLRRRFGDHILQQLDKAFGREEEFIAPIHPPVAYQERLPCPDPVLHVEGVQHALMLLLKNLIEKVKNDGKGIRTIVFKLLRTDHKMLQLEIATNFSTINEKHLYSLFAIKLETLQTEPGIELFILEAAIVEDLQHAQEVLWKQTTTGNDQEMLQLIDRLSVKFGMQNIYRFLPAAHHWPERSYKISTSFNDETSVEWNAHLQRPMILLPTPALIEVAAPVPDYPPMLFRYKGKLHKIVKADGPERIEQEWWIAQGQHRDYYVVEDEDGCRYWLFRSGHYDAEKSYQWFLHGYFA